MPRSVGLNVLLYWAAFIKLPGNNAVCRLQLSVANCYSFHIRLLLLLQILHNIYRGGSIFHTAGLLLFPIHRWPPATLSCLWWLHPDAVAKISQDEQNLTSPVSSEGVLPTAREDESFKAKLLSGVLSFWQQFLNVLISKTPRVKKITPVGLSRGLSSEEKSQILQLQVQKVQETHHLVGHILGN